MVTFTTNPIYYRPLVPRITIKSLDNTTTYYTYDPWTDVGTTTKAVGCSVQLSQNHQGVFSVQIEDQTNAISSNVNLGARVIIECGKQSTQMTRLISGLIRQKGYSRGADNKRLYTLSGSSTAIRLNEIIINVDTSARKLSQDNITIDITDPNFKADVLLQNQLATLTSDGVATAANLAANSDVENFIPSLQVSFGELQDVCNIIEEQTNGEIFVDVNDVVLLRHQLQPFMAGKGFAIKNKNATNDNADDTMYLRGKSWDYVESAMKSDSYSNQLYGILPTDQVPELPADRGGGGLSNPPNTEWAIKFRPTHSHWLPGDLYVVGSYWNNVATTPVQAPYIRFRICTDTGGVPTNTAGGVVCNIDFGINSFGDMPETLGTASPITMSNYQVFRDSAGIDKASLDLNTTDDYWLILSDDFTLAQRYLIWQTPAAGSTVAIKTHTTNMSTNSTGGSSWVNSTQRLPQFFMPRKRSQAYQCADPKGIAAIGSTISSTLSNIPASITTKEAIQKYLVNQLYYMARPRANFNMATVTAPNVPIIPGDPIMISDSVMGFSTAGTQAVMTTCGDMTYSWQIGQYQAPTILSIQPVGLTTRYK